MSMCYFFIKLNTFLQQNPSNDHSFNDHPVLIEAPRYQEHPEMYRAVYCAVILAGSSYCDYALIRGPNKMAKVQQLCFKI